MSGLSAETKVERRARAVYEGSEERILRDRLE